MGFLTRKTRQSSAEAFWSWFVNNKARVESVFNDPAVFDELMAQGQKYSKYVEFLIGKPDLFQLFVSCNGIKAGIPDVEKLVAAAPKIAGWEILAFKQPLPIGEFESEDGAVVYDDRYKVDAVSASFAFTKDGELYHLTIFSPKDRLEQGHKFAYFLLLDMLLGEYFVMTRLGNIELVSGDGTDHPALSRLRDYLPVEEKHERS